MRRQSEVRRSVGCRWIRALMVGLVGLAGWPVPGLAAAPASPAAAIAQASQFLIEQGQESDGSFSPQVGPAVTALAVTALVESGTPADHAAVTKGIDYLLSFRQPDGGIHRPDSVVANYETAIALVALVTSNTDCRHDDILAAAQRFLTGIQWDGADAEAESPTYGSAGYGSHQRPDLSNTAFLIEALRTAGAGEDDPAIQRALVFVSRSEKLEGPHNTLPMATKNPDGGFYYAPANGGESQAGETPAGGLRSYGSMTYSGLKSMIYAGVAKDDPRVVAATDWLRRHYTFAENPGRGMRGTTTTCTPRPRPLMPSAKKPSVMLTAPAIVGGKNWLPRFFPASSRTVPG